MAEKDENYVKKWLEANDDYAKAFVEGYIHSHPVYAKELVQRHMDQKQQMLTPMYSNALNVLSSLKSEPSSTTKSLKHVRSAPNISSRRSAKELRKLNKQEMLMELLRDVVSPDFDINSLSHKILVNVLLLTNADRSSLFLVEGSKENPILVSRLFDVTEQSSLENVLHDESEAIKIPFGVGIVGQVALTGKPINLHDAYQDPRFNTQIDKLTGYRTKAIMCMPIKTTEGQVIGVAQVINKRGQEEHFSDEDEEVFNMYLTFCAIGLINVQLFDQSFAQSRRLQILLQLTKELFEDTTSLEEMIKRIMLEAQELIPCQRCVILLVDEDTRQEEIIFSTALQYNVLNVENEEKMKSIQPSSVEGLDIALLVARTGNPVNMTDKTETNNGIQIKEHTHCVLCMPIFNSKHEVIGVVKMDNKLNGLPFNVSEQETFEVFVTFCGLGIHNVLNYEKILLANAKQSVALEVLSYHATASGDEANRFMSMELPDASSILLTSFKFDDMILSEDETITTSYLMFQNLELVSLFHIDPQTLCRWILSVRKNYRPVTYHNWRHAFNVAQSMFAMLTDGNMGNKLDSLEKLALLVSCFCHDLDHRGTNNAFQSKIDSPLAQLYTTSTMEHHHFDHCIMILNGVGNNILKGLSSSEYERVIHMIESAILSTDLALYFKKKGQFMDLVHNKNFNWENSVHRDTLKGMMMTACDVAAITKPWEIQQRTAELVASEFFEQGDKERDDLHLEPIPMMDRKKKDELPKMQVGFIDAICLPLYKVLAELESGLTPMLTGVQNNRTNWQALSENKPPPHTGQTVVTQPHTTTTTSITAITPSVAIGNRTGPVETSPPCIEAWSSDIKLESTHLRSSQKGSSKRKSKKCSIC